MHAYSNAYYIMYIVFREQKMVSKYNNNKEKMKRLQLNMTYFAT